MNKNSAEMKKCLYFLLILVNKVFGFGEVKVQLKKSEELVIEGEVSASSDKEYLIQVSSSGPIRIHSQLNMPSRNHPVVFMIRTENAVKSWKIPTKTSGNSSEYSSTLCRGIVDEGDF